MAESRHAIFIGYRRDDSADVAGRIYDQLEAKFGAERVFKDVDSIPRGAEFRAYVSGVIGRCSVFLAIIGQGWANATSAGGARRLDDPNDLVRVEIETALATPGVRVIPVLVGGVNMPTASDLPASLHPLLARNAALVRRDPDFRADVLRLIRDVEATGETLASTRAEAPSTQSESHTIRPSTWKKRGEPLLTGLLSIAAFIGLAIWTPSSTNEVDAQHVWMVIAALGLLSAPYSAWENSTTSIHWDQEGVARQSPFGETYFPWSDLRRVQKRAKSLSFRRGILEAPVSYASFEGAWQLERYAQSRLPPKQRKPKNAA